MSQSETLLKFKCPSCGSSHLGLKRSETTITGYYFDNDGTLQLGKEEVIDCDLSVFICTDCNYELLDENAVQIDTEQELIEWIKEHQ